MYLIQKRLKGTSILNVTQFLLKVPDLIYLENPDRSEELVEQKKRGVR